MVLTPTFHFLQKEVPLLLVPDVLVCSVGTEIFFESTGEADKGWQQVLDKGWDRAAAVAAAEGVTELVPQVGLRAWEMFLMSY